MGVFCYLEISRSLFEACGERSEATDIITVLFNWQTLAAALVAGLPAAVGAFLLWRQIDDQRRESRRVRQQQEIAARIKMPHALAELSNYWKHCFRAIVTEQLQLKTDPVPSTALQVIMAAAPALDETTFENARNLVTLSQIFESRLLSAQRYNQSGLLPELITDVARLDYYTDAFYSFARFESDEVQVAPPNRRDLSNQIFSHLDMHERICATEGTRLVVESALNKAFPRGEGDTKETYGRAM